MKRLPDRSVSMEVVQGVGFRPTVSRHAAARGIHGNVCNKGPYVEIYAQGPEEAVSWIYFRYRESTAEACGKSLK